MKLPYAARSDSRTAAEIVGCQTWQIPKLVSSGVLSPLNPKCPNAVKWFLTSDLLRRTAEPKWQLDATAVLTGESSIRRPYRPTKTGSARQRGLARASSRENSSPVSAERMIEGMLASMALDPTTGKFLPALLNDDQVARILGFHKHDMAPLRRAGILECINPRERRPRKMHSREYILGLVTNESKMAQATIEMVDHWQRKNANKSS